MDKNNLLEFERVFNETNRTVGDFFKAIKNTGISMENLGEPDETETEYIWEIDSIGSLHQCKTCKYIEFVELGNLPKKKCNT